MSLRDDLIPVVDGLRRVVDGIAGLRIKAVVVRTRTWSGMRLGEGVYTDAILTLDPVPKVRPPEPREVSSAAGTYEEGDLKVSAVSLTYTRAQLGDGTVPANTEIHWLIDNERHTLIALQEQFLGYTAHVRRARGSG